MPIYVYQCKEGHKFDVFKPLRDIDEPVFCECGSEAKRKIVPTMINCDIQPWDHYVSPASGKLITSYKERREDMKRSNCVDYDPGMRTDYDKSVKDSDRKLEKSIDQTVEKEFERMPTQKRERLANELLSGADVEYSRKSVTGDT